MKQPRKCKNCNKRYDKSKTTWNRLFCRPCHNEYQRNYYRSEKAQTRLRSTEFKERHKQQCQASLERNPENFIRAAYNRIIQTSAGRLRNLTRTVRTITVSRDYLIKLYYRQKGRCALSDLPLVHKVKSPYAISIDRIDHSKEYVKGNIQLVCQLLNFAKARFSNQTVLNFLAEVKDR